MKLLLLSSFLPLVSCIGFNCILPIGNGFLIDCRELIVHLEVIIYIYKLGSL
jgi:hypothetical protein